MCYACVLKKTSRRRTADTIKSQLAVKLIFSMNDLRSQLLFFVFLYLHYYEQSLNETKIATVVLTSLIHKDGSHGITNWKRFINKLPLEIIFISNFLSTPVKKHVQFSPTNIVCNR